MFKSATVEWPTPVGVYTELDCEFHFDLDPCPLGGTDDGLATLLMPWSGRRVFCNPPYNRTRKFLERWHEADVAVYLIPARTDTRAFHEIVLPHASEIRFIKGRLKFGNAQTGAPFPSMIVVFRSDNGGMEKMRLRKLLDELTWLQRRAMGDDQETALAAMQCTGRIRNILRDGDALVGHLKRVMTESQCNS